MTDDPLVWVVTPVYNGERYLSECIESVIAQTYGNWQHVIVDNCSTDRTPEIVRAYAEHEPRVRLERRQDFLPVIANWNRALRMIPSEARYCKVVHADDALLPECLQRMTEVAERNPSVAVVTSYALWGDEVRHEGIPFPLETVAGAEICRSTLLGRCYVFGSPSSLLLRADDVRSRPKFYNEDNLHADTEVCFDLLRDADLGFVHQVLTRTRVHAEAMTSFAVRVNTFHHAWLMIHLKYGRHYLGPREYYLRLAYRLRRYAVFLAKATVKAKFVDARFREHHGRTVRLVIRSLLSGATWTDDRRSVGGQAAPRDDAELRSRS